jgi:uncharacterized protein
MTASDVALVRSAWDAFARGDIAAATRVLAPEVRWYAAGDADAEGACHNREQAIAFIRRSLAQGVTAELLDIHDVGERLVVVIHAHTPPEWESRPEPHGELLTLRDGKVTEMVVYPTVDEALTAAGLNPTS